ncbi:MAG: 7TM diverse intracellular signaling domain-containing protein, partial [Halioglobus sp.]
VNFVIHFLDLARYRPGLVKPLKVIAALSILLIPTLILEHYAYTQLAIHCLNILAMAAMVVAVFSVFHSNRRPAVYLMASYSVLFSAIIFATLFQANFVQHYTYIDYSLSFAILVEAIILSIGLSERIAQLRLENERSERERRIIQERLSQQLIQTREKERSEFSKLLHDSVNHDLVVVRKKVNQLKEHDGSQSSLFAGKTQAIEDLLDNAINEIRDISHLWHPQIVKHLGLEAALKALLENTFDSSITWDLYMDEVDLDYDSQLFLYRAVQESTTNIIKYANASECLIRLRSDSKNGSVQFILKDDGDGFDASPNNWGFGLRTLNEHCKSLAGLLKIQSGMGGGTVMTILLPAHT